MTSHAVRHPVARLPLRRAARLVRLVSAIALLTSALAISGPAAAPQQARRQPTPLRLART